MSSQKGRSGTARAQRPVANWLIRRSKGRTFPQSVLSWGFLPESEGSLRNGSATSWAVMEGGTRALPGITTAKGGTRCARGVPDCPLGTGS